ncbi:MAG TPA: MFS transporter [Pseudonocardiaceae bacterium]|nr:MFS transporter [Pseudonocardiaceae bacterium]
MPATHPADTPTPVDAVAELRSAPFGRFHLMLVVSIMLATIFDGYDTLNPSYVIHFTVRPWHLSHAATGLMVASGLVGFLVGALAHGPIADQIGRRPVLLGALFGTGVLSALTAFAATGFSSFLLLRFLTGIFLGVIMPLGTAYINEFTPARSANRVVVAAISGYPLGGVLASLVGIYLTPGHGWQILYWIGAAPFVLGLILLPLLPESVQFQVLRGRDADVARTLTTIRGDRAERYRAARFLRPRGRATTGEILRTVLGPRLRRTSIALWVCAFMILFCIYGLSGWLPSVMETRGNSFAASFVFLTILQVAGIAGGIVAAVVSDRRGGRLAPGLVALMVVAAVGIIVVGVSGNATAQLVFTGFAGFGIIGGQAVLDTLSAQTYPAHLRSTGTGMMFGVGRVGGILGPYLIGWLLDWTGGSTGIVFTVIAVAIAAAALTGLTLALDRGATVAEPVAVGVPGP